ncbi:MAG: hypothetical protein DHS20C21_16310 [Gemmatimonadota bacterium]|nr:MAG: hypothetical protein DHS20C21_16310 [Gemmatimonadota bacterium]
MRLIRSVQRTVPPAARAQYLQLLQEFSAGATAAGQVKGFYLVENVERPGDFCEFWEYADQAHADSHAERAALGRQLADLLPDTPDVSHWQQRL